MNLVLVDGMGETYGFVGKRTGIYAKDKKSDGLEKEVCVGDYVQFNGTGLLSFIENESGIVCEYNGHITIMDSVGASLEQVEIVQILDSYRKIDAENIEYLLDGMLYFREYKYNKQEFLKDETDGNFTGLCMECGSTDVTMNLGFVEEPMQDLSGVSYAYTAYMNVKCVECHNTWSVYCGQLEEKDFKKGEI